MLRVPRTIAEEQLARHVEQGRAVQARASLVGDSSDYEAWKADRKQWVELTAQGLAHLYDSPDDAARFKSAASTVPGGRAWQEEYASDVQCVRRAIDILATLEGGPGLLLEPAGAEITPKAPPAPEHVAEPPEPDRADPAPEFVPRLVHEPARSSTAEPAGEPEPPAEPLVAPEPTRSGESPPEPAVESVLAREPEPESLLAPEPAGSSLAPQDSAEGAALPQEPSNGSGRSMPATPPAESQAKDLSKRVFIVHGRNEKWKHAVARVLERSGPYEVTILHERPSEGRTLIEQATGSGYAVVLLTADDVGGPRLEPDKEPYYSRRARQSVVFEMGLLVGVLTPRYVCVLYERGVDLPSEVDGLAYVLLDMAGAWQSKLLLALRNAGFDYDPSRLALA